MYVMWSRKNSLPIHGRLFFAEMEGFDLRCGAGHLGLKRTPGAFPSALGFESHTTIKNEETTHKGWLLRFGGDGGIRTPGRCYPPTDFESESLSRL